MTINEGFSSEAIKHLHYLERYKTYQVKNVQSILKKTEQQLRVAILSYGENAIVTKAKQKQLLADVLEIEALSGDKIQKTVTAAARDFSAVEQEALLKQAKKAVPGQLADYYSFRGLPVNKLWATVSEVPLSMADGTTMTIDDFISGFNVRSTDAAHMIINQGFLMGDTPQQLTKRLLDEGIYAGRMARSAVMVRTVFSHVQSEARNAVFQENSDIVKGYQWVSTLDANTTPICADRDGKVWIYEGNDTEGYDLLPGPVTPPAHYGCRSTTIPITKSYRELGLDIDEVPPGLRAAANGQVPADQTYFQWLESQSDDTLKDVLGPTRFEMYKAGDVKLKQFYDDGSMLTLEELKKSLD